MGTIRFLVHLAYRESPVSQLREINEIEVTCEYGPDNERDFAVLEEGTAVSRPEITNAIYDAYDCAEFYRFIEGKIADDIAENMKEVA